MTPEATTYLGWSIAVVVCTGLDALYCGMESGIYRLNKIRLELHADAGNAAAVSLQRMLRRFDHLLAVMLIGTNLCRYIVTFGVSAMFIAAGFGDRAQWLTLAVVTPAMFVLGDSVPKNVFHRSREALIYRLVWLMRISEILFTACGLAPLVRAFASGVVRLLGRRARAEHALARRRVERIVAEGRACGLLTDYQTDMVDRAVRFADVRLGDILSPIQQAVTADATATRDDLIDLLRRRTVSQLPLRDASGQVVAVVDNFDLLLAGSAQAPVDLAAEPLVLDQRTSLSHTLVDLQRRHTSLAVVADSAGRHIGVVTIRDITEQLVGELAEDWD